jgi:riboflavin kinase / FMN adenylyltransferase
LKVYRNINKFSSENKTIATLGTFDGVHLGHRKIIDKLVAEAQIKNLESIVLTFFPHPRMIVQPQSEIKLINTLSEKERRMERLGLDNLIIHPFTKEFSQLSAEVFVEEILVKKLNIRKIIIGYDHKFGKNRTADINDLIRFGKKYDFEVEQISAQEIAEVSVSSTKIRKALDEGNLPLANSYLVDPFPISGRVVKGREIGRTIGFPTANLELENLYKIVPKPGVYIVQTLWNNRKIRGMMNIGMNPTVSGTQQSIEIHFFEFNENLYNQYIEVEVLKYLRPEQKFESLEALQKQLKTDQTLTLAFFDAKDYKSL